MVTLDGHRVQIDFTFPLNLTIHSKSKGFGYNLPFQVSEPFFTIFR